MATAAIYGAGSQTRDHAYVGEVVRAAPGVTELYRVPDTRALGLGSVSAGAAGDDIDP